MNAAHDDEIKKWKAKAEEHLDGWKRAKADYLNLKRETEKSTEDMAKFASAAVIVQILPIADHLRRAVEHIPADERDKDWVKGVAGIKKEMDALFDRMELKPVPTHTFDPAYHEAVAKEKREGVKEGAILDIIEMGYTLHGKVIKHAKVKVAE